MKNLRSNLTRSIALGLLSAATAATIPTALGLTPAETTGVLYMKQEEKLARDLYQALAVRWDNAMFRCIANAEQRHMDAVDGLIARNQLVDATPAEAGRFSIPELQKLYDDLLVQGSASLSEALRVGVAVEEADLADLKEALGVTKDGVVQRVLGNLSRASTHHLDLFTAAVGGASTETLCPAGAGGKGTCTGDPANCERQAGTCGAGGAGAGSGACLKQGASAKPGSPTGCTMKEGAGLGAGAGVGAGAGAEPLRRGRR